MLSIIYEKQASKFLKKLAVHDDVKRIFGEVEALAVNPFPKEAARVEGYRDAKVFRARVGQYRILYVVDYEKAKLYVMAIDKRERVY
ncbi:type II toxin-antitoxin system RelE/ParE family toxin [Candidatus Woesearchaeota archaeon]|nr:type II toxin-antitoxin system RelE/ParE family toxin [Candidatus Woesearchaeota archaeon]